MTTCSAGTFGFNRVAQCSLLILSFFHASWHRTFRKFSNASSSFRVVEISVRWISVKIAPLFWGTLLIPKVCGPGNCTEIVCIHLASNSCPIKENSSCQSAGSSLTHPSFNNNGSLSIPSFLSHYANYTKQNGLQYQLCEQWHPSVFAVDQQKA